uniref:CCR4-NOT transcription complex subunit 1 n=1 Tax=Globodera rostochiensis TaxID=31243 RepID=A0A914HCW9_GLORO
MDMIGGGEPSLNELIRKVQELGAMFTSSMENCQQNIHSLTGGTLLDAQTVANIITAMVTTMESPFSSQKNNWELMLGAAGASAALPYEGTTFVAAVKAEAPSLDWHEVFSGLDNPHFQVRTKAGLQLLTLVLISGIAPNPFPVGLLYRPWSVNKPGQLSWLTQIIHHPDVFNVIDYPHHPVNLSCLKVFPDERNISVWKCLDLFEVLFRLGEVPALDTHILSLFRSPGPMLTCPDLLFLGIVQINMPSNQLRDYMLKCLISSLLAGHANTVAVLQFALNHAKNKMNDILRNAIVVYYSQNLEDQGRLTRILEIAHELKILGELLSMTQFPFVIDLATLAARRDYLKLDKFIEDKLTEHGERFAQDLCHYLRRRCPVLTSINPLTNDTFHSMFSTLQQRAAVWPMITADLNQLIAQISRGKATPAAQQFGGGGGVNPFVPLKASESRVFANTPSAGGANPFTLFQHQRDQQQIMRSIRSTPGSDFHEFRLPSSQIPSTSPSNQPIEFGDDLTNAVFSEDIQEEANSYFQQIYAPNGRMSVNDFIVKLKGFRHSGNIKERELLLCVVKNLFDEYRFFREYPERELRTTAEVYGGIIREGIVLNIQFATAIRRVIESLNDEPGSMLWTFGIVALNACRACLYKYPKVCHMVASTNSYGRFPPGLRDFVNAGSLGQLPMSHTTEHDVGLCVPIVPTQIPMTSVGTASNIKFPAPRGTSSGNSILNVTNVDTLISATEREGIQVKQPSQTVFEKVAFICNNLCTNNLMDKTQELNDLIRENSEDFLQWFAQYLVMKRVTVEHNFQQLYNSFLVLINNTSLDGYTKKETYRNINILLQSDKRQAVSNFGDRQLLKNLGHWLGIITIGRDRPILSKDLDLKYLLFEAFYKGQQELLYIVPFVVKCITSSAKSQLFGPNCGWIYALLKVLAEIHNEPDLKLNLRFEIEVLCKELNVDLRSIEVGSYLKEQRRLPQLVPPVKHDGPSPILSQHQFASNMPLPPSIGAGIPAEMHSTDYTQSDLSNMLTALSISRKDSPAGLAPGASLAQQQQQIASLQTSKQQFQQSHQTLPTFNYADNAFYTQAGLLQNIAIPQHLLLFQMQPQLKMICKTAVIHAIRELIAHQMMRSMTAAIASITCREPLFTQMIGILKQVLANAMGNVVTGSDQARMVEEAAISVTETNITVATNFIVKSTCERAVADVEKRLEPEYVMRKSASEDRPFQTDSDITEMSEKVPILIRLQEAPVSETMMKVYDDYSSKICGFKPLGPDDRFVEFTRRGQMTTPAAPSRTPTNALAPPFIPSTNQMIMSDVRPPTTTLHSVIPSQHPPPIEHSTAIISGERMPLPPGVFPEDQGFYAAPVGGLGIRKLNEDQILQNKVESILREWIGICYTPMAQKDPQHALACIVQMMHDNGVLATDEMITKFFRHCAEICFDVSYRLLKNENSGQSTIVRQRCYYTLDAFTKLTCLMVKYSDGQHHSTKVNLLKKVLTILTNALNKDHEQRKFDFNGLPFHRILIIMFNELTAPDPVLDSIQWNILESFGQALFLLQPRRVPGFTFHWLDIIGHRNFIGRLLSESQDLTRTGAMYTQLILCHLKFLAPFLRNVQLPKPIAYIYKGTLRVLLVILHDFPEILCEYHYVLCDVIPANCVQLRNLILSAYPRDMRLPDPFTETLARIENLPEMSNNPKTHREMTNIIPKELRQRLDDYLETRSVSYLSDLPSMLLFAPQQQTPSSHSPSSKYAISVVNAVVMYVGVRAIDSIHDKGQRISTDTIAHTAFMDIFQNLAVSLCTEGRYLLFNAIANQLRYPNSHTHYFSCTLLYLFLGANSEHIQEQITRILFERLVALRPHPWGLLITFIELIRNLRYGFWKHDFVRCATEIERLFLSVANSCSVSGPENNHSNGI